MTKLGLVLIFASDWFSGPITSEVKRNQNNPGLLSTLHYKLLFMAYTDHASLKAFKFIGENEGRKFIIIIILPVLPWQNL